MLLFVVPETLNRGRIVGLLGVVKLRVLSVFRWGGFSIPWHSKVGLGGFRGGLRGGLKGGFKGGLRDLNRSGLVLQGLRSQKLRAGSLGFQASGIEAKTLCSSARRTQAPTALGERFKNPFELVSAKQVYLEL